MRENLRDGMIVGAGVEKESGQFQSRGGQRPRAGCLDWFCVHLPDGNELLPHPEGLDGCAVAVDIEGGRESYEEPELQWTPPSRH